MTSGCIWGDGLIALSIKKLRKQYFSLLLTEINDSHLVSFDLELAEDVSVLNGSQKSKRIVVHIFTEKPNCSITHQEMGASLMFTGEVCDMVCGIGGMVHGHHAPLPYMSQN